MKLPWAAISAISLSTLLTVACGRAESSPVGSDPFKGQPVRARKASPVIEALEKRVERVPSDFVAHNKLAQEYLQQMRETGDVAFLELALLTANRSLAIAPAEQNIEGLAVLAQAEYSSHNFTASRQHAEQLLRLDPGKGYTFQLLGDSLLELGEYEKARDAFGKMVEFGGIQPMTKVAMHQRLARLSMLNGDNRRGEQHLETALSIAGSMLEPPRETIAWCRWQLGETAFAWGKYEKAEEYYRQSLAGFPGYYRSVASLGRVLAAKGDLEGSIREYEKVTAVMPDPKYIAALGDVYAAAGRTDDAARQFEIADRIGKLSNAKTGLYNRELALFYADHGIDRETAYQMAANEYSRRRDIYGADALAWTALKAGKIEEARSAIREAMKLGTQDPRIYYHAGMIAAAAGEGAEAKSMLTRALSISPAFDPMQAATARLTLRELN